MSNLFIGHELVKARADKLCGTGCPDKWSIPEEGHRTTLLVESGRSRTIAVRKHAIGLVLDVMDR
jgi:hypothetical protein